MSAEQWRISTSTDAPGWLDMPDPGEPAVDAAWLARRESEARAAFGARWTAQHEQIVPVLLRAGLDRRAPGDLIAWQVWPLALPVFATVRAWVEPAGAADRLADDATVVQPVESRGLGEGLQLHASERPDIAPEMLVTATVRVFDDGASALVVALEPTPHELLAFASSGLREVVDRMEVTRPDGSRFRGQRAERFVTTESWGAA